MVGVFLRSYTEFSLWKPPEVARGHRQSLGSSDFVRGPEVWMQRAAPQEADTSSTDPQPNDH
jgi:hypothetical protein